MQLTPEDIEKVRTKNIANLLRLANSGKPLNRAQQAELEAFSAGGRDQRTASSAFAKTQDELAQLLGISRKTITNCLRRHKQATPPVPQTRADGRYDVAAWAAFLRAHNVAHKAEDHAPTDITGDRDGATNGLNTPASVTEWKQEKLRLECERLKLELAKAEGRLVEVAEMEGQLGVMLAAFRTSANNLPGRASQKLIGLKDYHDIEAILNAEIAVMLRTLEACPFLPEIIGLTENAKTAVMLEQSGTFDDVAGEAVPTAVKKQRTALTHSKLPKRKKRK